MVGVILNPFAGGGTALRKWKIIESEIRSNLGAFEFIVLDRSTDVKKIVSQMICLNTTEFIAAGGDGTVNLLLNAIDECSSGKSIQKIKLGAVGLGSSNDFHKPFRNAQLIEGIPCKVNFSGAVPRDVGVITYENGEGNSITCCWIINASIGVTAEANFFFNTPDATLRFLKRASVESAILYAALRSIAAYRNQEMSIAIGNEPPLRAPVTNLGVVKSPHFSGNFCYDSPFRPDSGTFNVHLCERMSLPRTLLTLWGLSRKKFSGLPHTRSWSSCRIMVRANKSFAVEFDGEVVSTHSAVFSIKPKLLQVCK
ncbi:MAG: diacylglycerol kinase family protein [Bacteroidota bacterium]